MTRKHRWKNFWTLHRKSNAGFTLVELIIVIAILAILAGVGTVGYSGYIKYSKKNADKVLVGNIMRAIEVGTNSTMFVSDDSFKMGAISYPVGFVALSDTGVQVVMSKAQMSKEEVKEAGPCVFETIKVDTLEEDTWKCPENSREQKAIKKLVEDKEVTYCAAHSKPVFWEAGVPYISGYSCGDGGCDHGHTEIESETSDKTLANFGELQQMKGNGLCEIAYIYQDDAFYQGDTFKAEPKIVTTTTGPIYDALEAAFGDVSKLKLTYNGWTSDEGIDYASFYTSAPKLMSSMKSLSGLLALGSKQNLFDLGLTRQYEDSEDVLEGVSQNISSVFEEKAASPSNTEGKNAEDFWMDEWRKADSDQGVTSWSSTGFGLGGRENYSAARMAYNNGFASYLQAVDSSFADDGENQKYRKLIEVFYSQSYDIPFVGELGLPGLVCTSAFTSPDSPLDDNFKAAGDTDLSVFNKVYRYYQDYMKSSAFEENGRLFYQIICTFNDTVDIAQSTENAFGGDMFAYYTSYVNEIAALYTAAQNASGNGIIIIVTVENGVVKCDVSPSAANPRK